MPQRTDPLRELLKRKSSLFFGFERAVLTGDDADAIHDMRVASRRLQEALCLVFPEAPEVDGMLRVIRRARRAQSAVRDLDVMTGRLRGMVKKSRGEARTALQWVLKALAARRQRRLRKMTDALKALDLNGLRKGLDRQFATLARMPGDPETSVSQGATARRARAQIAARTEAFHKAVALSRARRDPEDLHAARIAGKRLRYILEVSDELQVGAFKRPITHLRAVQQALGQWHDLEVLEETVAGLLADPAVFRRRLPLVRTACDLIEAWRAEREAHLQAFFSLTKAVVVRTDRAAPGPSRRART